ncbi:hypothetical protein ACF0H5_007816 [Mactra antiquata]
MYTRSKICPYLCDQQLYKVYQMEEITCLNTIRNNTKEFILVSVNELNSCFHKNTVEVECFCGTLSLQFLWLSVKKKLYMWKNQNWNYQYSEFAKTKKCYAQ